MKLWQKILLTVNLSVISAIFVLNYFYQSNGFDFTLKCICSGLFAALGLVNLCHAPVTGAGKIPFHVSMATGLVLAFLGDYLIGYDFVVGAATFALGHVCFVVAYCLMQRMRMLDFVISGGLFVGCAVFLVFCPLLTFDPPMLRGVCIAYALIISTMLGKAVGNFIRERNTVTGIIAVASGLFFFSDLMLVFDRFIGLWDWTAHACMGTYYPALCLLAFAMCVSMLTRREGSLRRD